MDKPLAAGPPELFARVDNYLLDNAEAAASEGIIFTTLDAILFGGIYDHIGGGFFRHAMDERWSEP